MCRTENTQKIGKKHGEKREKRTIWLFCKQKAMPENKRIMFPCVTCVNLNQQERSRKTKRKRVASKTEQKIEKQNEEKNN